MARLAIFLWIILLCQADIASAASKSHTIQASCSILPSATFGTSFSETELMARDFQDSSNLQETLTYRQNPDGKIRLHTFTAL
jgi:hypothetical protein